MAADAPVARTATCAESAARETADAAARCFAELSSPTASGKIWRAATTDGRIRALAAR